MDKNGKKNPLISIIVPVYNVSNYVSQCIQSIVEQTYSEIEILIIDDGSTDLSPVICDRWQMKEQRINVIHTDNYGVSHARNIGLEYAHGEYVGFVDADDWIEPDFYEELVKEIMLNDADVASGGYTREEINGGLVTLKKDNHNVYSREEILLEIFSCESPKILYWEVWDKLFRKDIITNIQFDESIDSAEDMLFFWQAMKNVNRFAYVPSFKYHYRMRDGSAVHSGITAKKLSANKAIQRIWQLAQYENERIKNVVFLHYVVFMISLTKDMILYNDSSYEADIKLNQKTIRNNLPIILKNSFVIGKRIAVGSLIMCLPFQLCTAVFRMICNKNRENIFRVIHRK